MFSLALTDDAELFPLEVWHAEEFLAHLDRGREFIGQHVNFPNRATDLDSARALLADNALKAAADGPRLFGIRLAGTLVGGVLYPAFDAAQGVAEVGCWLEPTATGRGLITRACRVLIDHAIHERGIHRVEWHVSSANAPSIAVARRLGMTREGVLREQYLYRGVRQDTEIWSVLAPEWKAAADR
ncbi:GNAT family N-acetyltransferase [Streptomyces sp. BI20]|uniref:GNAT family N-acetyltransferase n=1 Tax=Streptomyces sp. BI20 TaxID=3403460 RepID=UPI003C77BE8A